MSAPVATSPLFTEDGSRFVPHIVRLKDIVPDLRAAMTEVWDAIMGLNRYNDTLLPDTLTDRFLAQYMGRSRRFVQKGLKGLQDKGIIFRHTKLGRRNIEIKGRIAGRKEQKERTAAGDAPKPAPRKARPGPAPGPPEKPLTPGQAAAAAAAIQAAAAAAEPDAEPDAPSARRPGETTMQWVKRLAASLPSDEATTTPAPAPRPTPRPRVNPALDRLDPVALADVMGELRARIDGPARE